MSDCEYDNQLSPYLDGELAADRRQATEAHLRDCPTCTGELQKLKALSEKLRNAHTPHLSSTNKGELRRRALLAATEPAGIRWVRWISAAAAVLFIVCMSQVLISQLTRMPGNLQQTVPAVTKPAEPPKTPEFNKAIDAAPSTQAR